jgi:hypothetical protein
VNKTSFLRNNSGSFYQYPESLFGLLLAAIFSFVALYSPEMDIKVSIKPAFT